MQNDPSGSSVPGRTEHFRVYARTVERASGTTTLLVGVNRDDITDPVALLKRLLAITVPAAVALGGVLAWVAASAALAPVERMRKELGDITSSTLERRVHSPTAGDEISRLATTMNATLDRLEDAVRRQQRLVADASHELRGPLQRIRSEVELSADRAALLREVDDLQRLVDDLLMMARNDAGAAVLRFQPVDLDDIVLREARRLRDRARVAVDISAVAAGPVEGDAAQLTRAVRNLLDNAERHARSRVTLRLTIDDGSVTLVVEDDGTGIAPQHRAHIFDRFTRLDEARTRDAGGSGLGLAIARDVIERHNGSVRLSDALPTRFIVILPERR